MRTLKCVRVGVESVCVFVCEFVFMCVCVCMCAYLRKEKLLFISNCCFDLEMSATRIINNTVNDHWVF